MSDSLTHKTCKPCEGGVKPLTNEQAEKLQEQVPKWEVITGIERPSVGAGGINTTAPTPASTPQKISRTFIFKNFVEAVEFVNRVKDIAEAEHHHPDLYLHEYRNLRIDLSTHSIGGLSENDFIVAAKIDDV